MTLTLGRAARVARLLVGRPLGWVLRLALPSTRAGMYIAEPVQRAITWVDTYPQYRVMG